MADAEHIQVQPTDLHYTGHQLNGMSTDCDTTFSTAHSGIETAVASGWVGASATAMSSRLDTMRASAQSITTRLGDHSTHMHSAGNSYTHTDDGSAHSLGSSIKGGPGDTELRL